MHTPDYIIFAGSLCNGIMFSMSSSSFTSHPLAFPLLLLILLSLLAGSLAYQSPVDDGVAIGWAGDRLFLAYNAGLGQDAVRQGAFYADDLTPDSPTGRSRWTRQHAVVRLPNVGRGVDLQLTLLVQGWPEDVLAVSAAGAETTETTQPHVTVWANGVIVDTFTPSPQWAEYSCIIPASLHNQEPLRIELETSHTFTHTERGKDPRPKGVRLAGVSVAHQMATGAWQQQPTLRQQFQVLVSQVLPPAWGAVGLLLLVVVLWYALLLRLRLSLALAFLLATLAAGLGAAGLALLRLWMGAVLQVSLWLLLVTLLLAWHAPLLRLLRLLLRRYGRGYALHYGLIVAALAGSGYAIGKAATNLQTSLATGSSIARMMFPDSLLIGLLGATLLVLLLLLGREGLPRFVGGVADGLRRPTVGLTVLLLAGGIWLGYEAVIVARLPYVGHADYADNAVVARNIVAGRGWVVDYITQFYQLYAGTTRPQETWPLLQPLWIAPFLAMFGEHAWAVKIPNLLFNALLLLLIFTIGTRLWDRRVGLVAALLTLTSHLFFKLTIYATSDLAFVVFTTAAVYLMQNAECRMQNAGNGQQSAVSSQAQPLPTLQRSNVPTFQRSIVLPLLGSGVLTGLMLLQKPASALIATGMGIWLMLRIIQHQGGRLLPAGISWQRPRSLLQHPLLARMLLWAVPALLIFTPYVVRNLTLFQTPVYSTERYDAWVLGYRGDSSEAWEDIYRVYVPALGGAGVPDRSWILRWGFDHTLDKFITQVEAVRDYLLPAWKGLPQSLAGKDGQIGFLSQNERKNLFSPLGAWLALAGIIAALAARRRLLSLLFLAFAPYTLFLVTYWHANEERYFLMLIPWLALLSAWVLWAVFDRMRAIGDGRWAPLGFVLVGLSVYSIMQFSWPIIASKVEHEPDKWAPDLAAYAWIEQHTPSDAVVMTRNPWQLNWHTSRAAVMIPNTSDYDILMFLARYYDVDYIVFDSLMRVKGDAARVLAPLINPPVAQVGERVDGFKLVYVSPTEQNRVLVYALPRGSVGALKRLER